MTTAAAPQTLGQILFYRQLEPLSLEKHRGLGVSQVPNPFSFLADTHLVPLTVDEFGLAAVCYPIIFDTQSKTPLAVMGLRPGMNVFLGADGSLDPEVYLPAFARRYPFLPILAGPTPTQPPPSQAATPEGDGDRVLVCIDRSAKMVSQNAGAAVLRRRQALALHARGDPVLPRVRHARPAHAEFVKLMDQHDLFELTPLALPRLKADGTPDEPQKIGEYLRISEQKLNALPKDTFLELRDRGVSAVMHAHLLSLGLWPKILSRAARIQASDAAELNAAGVTAVATRANTLSNKPRPKGAACDRWEHGLARLRAFIAGVLAALAISAPAWAEPFRTANVETEFHAVARRHRAGRAFHDRAAPEHPRALAHLLAQSRR